MSAAAPGEGSIRPLPRPLYLALALGFCLSWASAFPAAKLVVEAAPPLLALGMRFLLAGGLLLAWFAARGGRLGALPWRRLALLGLLNQVGYMGFAWLGMTSVSAGLATIIASLNPVLVGALAAPVLGERMHGRKLLGLLLGLAGAAIVVRERVALDHERMVG
ncbi:MAG: DMT family transporter, partial [Acetobacteraceae bacterium]